ncbi:axonemal dynein light intermediate polypeptide 1 [Aulostomus maculatus]
MNFSVESFLKYDSPILISKSPGRKPQKGHSYQSEDSSPLPSPPKARSTPGETVKPKNEEILNSIFPPREWTDGNHHWMQYVSTEPCTRSNVVKLEELLDKRLQEKHAMETGICPVRRTMYCQLFDELIRQVTICCAERGLLLLRVKNEIEMSIAAYQMLCESSVAFGVRKTLQAEQRKSDLEKKVSELEKEKQELREQLNKEKAQCEAMEKRKNERHQLEEKRFTDEIQFLKRSNQQLKAQLEGIITGKK